MSLERRLREGLQLVAADVDVAVESDLVGVARAARRHRSRQRLVVVIAACAAVAAAIILAPRLEDLVSTVPRLPPAERAPTPDPETASAAERRVFYAAVAGHYTTRLPRMRDAPDAAGAWTMDLTKKGEMSMTAPAQFSRYWGAPHGVSFLGSGKTLTIQGFVTAHCLGPGEYRWKLDDGRLRLVPTDEDCLVRRAVFASRPWIRS